MLRVSRPTLWQIARREALDHLSSLRFYVIVATMAVLVGVSTFVMYRDYSLRMANHAVLRERARPRPGESGVMAVVEPRPLSVFAKGLDEVMGRGYTVTAYVGIDVARSPDPAREPLLAGPAARSPRTSCRRSSRWSPCSSPSTR